MNRTIIIGDVHGCSDELDALLGAAGYVAGDRVVLVGDLVAKGPDSVGVVQRLRSVPNASAVRGNHDEAVLRAREVLEGKPSDAKIKRVHLDAAAQLTDADVAFLRGLPLWIELPDHATSVVHAGIVPGVALAEQKPEHLLTMRSIRPDGSASRRIEEGIPWASVYRGPMDIVFGHDAVRGLQRYDHAIGIDTGCVYGRSLTAWLLPERRLVSVPAKRSYVELGVRDE